MTDRIERMLDTLTEKVEDVRRAIDLHASQSAGNVAAIREDSDRLAETLGRVADVLVQLEVRLSAPARGAFPKFDISESTVKLALLVALAVALGGLTREGLSALITFAAHALGVAR